jgi:hypothetical protein
MKFILSFFLLSLLFFSCASHKYTEADRRVNNTVQITANVQNFQISFEPMSERQFKGMSGQKLHTNNGKLNYYIPKLNYKCRNIRIESPGYESEKIRIKRVIRGRAVGKDILLSLITGPGIFFQPFIIIDAFRSDFYKVSRKSKVIEVKLIPIK